MTGTVLPYTNVHGTHTGEYRKAEDTLRRAGTPDPAQADMEHIPTRNTGLITIAARGR